MARTGSVTTSGKSEYIGGPENDPSSNPSTCFHFLSEFDLSISAPISRSLIGSVRPCGEVGYVENAEDMLKD